MMGKRQKKRNFLGYDFLEKNHKGSHVGIVLSFVIFIAFLFFIFYILQPKLGFSANKQSFLTYLQTTITNNVSANFTIATIEFTSAINPPVNCIQLQNILLLTGFAIPKIAVKDEADITQTAYTVQYAQGNGNLTINRADASKHFFNLYYSPKFNDLTDKTGKEIKDMGCAGIMQTDYTVGIVKLKTEIFESEIDRLIANYNNDYSLLKTQMNVPSDTEFAFNLRKSDSTIKQPNYKAPTNANVYTTEIPILYVDSLASIKSGFLTILTW